MEPYEVYIHGEYFLFTLLMVMFVVGGFIVVSLVMLWAPKMPLVKRYGDEPEEARKTP